MKTKILVEVSARHAHLSQKDLEVLFGAGYQLKKIKDLSQPCLFAAEETVTIKTHSGILQNTRIVGPVREQTQVEISRTDAIYLHIDAPLRISGDIAKTPGAILVGPKGEVALEEGVMVVQCHIHCSPGEAKKLKLKNGAEVSVKIESSRSVIFEKVAVRVKDDYKLCMHIDTDEGNSAGINKTGIGILVKDKQISSYDFSFKLREPDN